MVKVCITFRSRDSEYEIYEDSITVDMTEKWADLLKKAMKNGLFGTGISVLKYISAPSMKDPEASAYSLAWDLCHTAGILKDHLLIEVIDAKIIEDKNVTSSRHIDISKSQSTEDRKCLNVPHKDIESAIEYAFHVNTGDFYKGDFVWNDLKTAIQNTKIENGEVWITTNPNDCEKWQYHCTTMHKAETDENDVVIKEWIDITIHEIVITPLTSESSFYRRGHRKVYIPIDSTASINQALPEN